MTASQLLFDIVLSWWMVVLFLLLFISLLLAITALVATVP
jgi:hypothetical protein